MTDAVSLIDTACARVAVSLHATPAEVDDCMKRIESLETEQGIIGRESVIGIDTAKRSALVEEQLTKERARLDTVSQPPLIYPYWHQSQAAKARLGPADLALHAPFMK